MLREGAKEGTAAPNMCLRGRDSFPSASWLSRNAEDIEIARSGSDSDDSYDHHQVLSTARTRIPASNVVVEAVVVRQEDGGSFTRIAIITATITTVIAVVPSMRSSTTFRRGARPTCAAVSLVATPPRLLLLLLLPSVLLSHVASALMEGEVYCSRYRYERTGAIPRHEIIGLS